MHTLTLRYEDGRLSATCACGHWHREVVFREEERPLQALDAVDDQFWKHVLDGGWVAEAPAERLAAAS